MRLNVKNSLRRAEVLYAGFFLEFSVPRDFKISFWIRVVFTLVLLFLVYSKIDFLNLLDRLSLVGISEFTICCGLYILGQILSILKWSSILKVIDIRPSNLELVRAYLLGMFINSFGLGTVGGDVARAFSIPCPQGRRGDALASVVADRIHGLTVLLLIGLISLLYFQPPSIPQSVLGISSVVALMFIVGWFIGPFLLIKILPEWLPRREKIESALKAFPKDKMVVLKITLISFIFHCLQIYMAYVIFKTLANDVNISTIFTTIPFVNVASALPLSINGIGVREAMSTYLLAPSGISSETSVAFSALWVFIVTLISGIGGLFVIPKLGENMDVMLKKIKTKG